MEAHHHAARGEEVSSVKGAEILSNQNTNIAEVTVKTEGIAAWHRERMKLSCLKQ